MTATEPLLAALEPYAKVRRFPGRLRVVDVREPFRVDRPTRLLVSDAVRPLLQEFLGPEYGPHLQPSARTFTLLDRMLFVVGAEDSDLRGWITYRTIAVHRRPVVWMQAIVTRAGLQNARAVPLVLGTWVAREWAHHRFQPIYLVGRSRNGQFIRFLRDAFGEDDLYPRPDGAQPADVRHVVEAVGHWMVHWLHTSAGAPGARLEADAQILRDTFAGAPRARPVGQLGPTDAYVVVGTLSARTATRQAGRVLHRFRARRRAEARRGGGNAAQR